MAARRSVAVASQCARAVAHTSIERQTFKKIRRVCKGVRGEARMQMFQHLEIRAPAAEGQVSGNDEQVAVIPAGEDGDLRTKHARRHGNRLNLVILADALRPLLAEARAHALDVGDDDRLPPAAADERIEDNGLEERQT
jgi:hypothetical protein